MTTTNNNLDNCFQHYGLGYLDNGISLSKNLTNLL
jgi:hypothetical protein